MPKTSELSLNTQTVHCFESVEKGRSLSKPICPSYFTCTLGPSDIGITLTM